MNDFKKQALESLSNVVAQGFNSASVAFAEMFELEIEASETTSEVTSMGELSKHIQKELFCIGEMKVSGTFDATGFVAFTPESAKNIARIALGYKASDEVDPEEVTDTVYEACNVIVNHFIGVFSKEYSIHFQFAPPNTAKSSLKDYIEENENFTKEEDYIILTGNLKSLGDDQTVDGKLFLVFSFDMFNQTVNLKATA